MFSRFLPSRRRRFRWQAIVWTAGMFGFTPILMTIFPFFVGVSWEEYSTSPLSFFSQGALLILGAIWMIGLAAMALTHLFNPLTRKEREERERLIVTANNPD